MGDISIGSFSVPIGPGSFCLICHLRGGALSVSPFRTLTGAYQSSLVAYATGDPRPCRPVFPSLRNSCPSHRRRWGHLGCEHPRRVILSPWPVLESINKKYADLRHTNCLIFVYIRPVRRHGLSLLPVGNKLPAPVPKNQVLRRIDYLQFSLTIQKWY